MFDRIGFEDGLADERMSGEDVGLHLDYPTYFDLLAGTPLRGCVVPAILGRGCGDIQ